MAVYSKGSCPKDGSSKSSCSGETMRTVGTASFATLSEAYSTWFENPYWSTRSTPHWPCILSSRRNANLKRPSASSVAPAVFPSGSRSVAFMPSRAGFADISTSVPASVDIFEGDAFVISPGSRRVYAGYASFTDRFVNDGTGTALTENPRVSALPQLMR